jgi:hypothetical protein
MQMLTSHLIATTAQHENEYPLLARHRRCNYVVLFSNATTGVVVNDIDKHFEIGKHASWSSVKDKITWEILPKGSEIILKVE